MRDAATSRQSPDTGSLRVGVREESFQHRAVDSAGIASLDQLCKRALKIAKLIELPPYASQVPLAQSLHIRTRRVVARRQVEQCADVPESRIRGRGSA